MSFIRTLRRALVAGLVTLIVATSGFASVAPVAAASAPQYVFLTGSDAASYALPTDVTHVFSWTDAAAGLDFARYQQWKTVNGKPVDVAGAQITVVSRNGGQVLVAGKYDPNAASAAVSIGISPAQAEATAARGAQRTSGVSDETGATLAHTATMMFEPTTDRLFYRVESYGDGLLVITDVDAVTGTVIQSWSDIQRDDPGTGHGVKGDVKTLTGDASTGPAALTTLASGRWLLRSANAPVNPRYVTYDAQNGGTYPSVANPMTDTDNIWAAGREKAATDAQYYAALTDHFYLDKHDFDLVGCLGVPIRSVVHFDQLYANAFWDPAAQRIVYGDGDGITYKQMSGAQDVVTHELTHAVTSCRAELDYQKESGALNEAFSDIMATAAEFGVEEPNTSNCMRDAGQASCADWWLAEDLILPGGPHGIRSLADPAALGQPSHYAQRANPGNCTPSYYNDDCGVHTNSGIANHAFYLLAHGGRNARCAGPADRQSDCDVTVAGIGVSDADHIIFDAWQGLTSAAQFCAARDMTVAIADLLYDDVAHHVSADLAWRAVGVGPCASSTQGAFTIGPSMRSPATTPGGSANVTIAVTRRSLNPSDAPIDFSVSDPAPASSTFAPSQAVSGTTSVNLELSVPPGALSGVYPLVVSATDGATTQTLSLVLIVDADPPSAQVTRVAFAAGDTVELDGHVPWHVSWASDDVLSGVVTGAVTADAAVIGSGTSGTETYAALDGSHTMIASAQDAAGNTADSAPLDVTQSSSQENAASYTRTWSALAATTAWGTTVFSKQAGATATFSFDGTDVAWVSQRGPKRGKAKVYIDGALEAKIDLKAAATSARQIVYTAGGLAAGPHTLSIYVKGTSGRPRVDIDGFVVLSPTSTP